MKKNKNNYWDSFVPGLRAGGGFFFFDRLHLTYLPGTGIEGLGFFFGENDTSVWSGYTHQGLSLI